ncbi:glycosyltransferase WbuB [Guyparkeria sp. SCN-R1]|nr:glycosyltransferase WbuB [Guyparkeria sp. SCN-R1]
MTGAEHDQEKKRLRVLAVHRYYWPDTPPYAAMLRRIVEHWRDEGHEVDVLSSQPSYKAGFKHERCPRHEGLNGVAVERLSLPNETGRPLVRIFNALRLGSVLLWKAITRRYDVIMISTAPPVLGGAAAALAARLTGARFIYHCMDIHPEVGRVSGEFRNPAVFTVLRALDNWSCRRADPVVVLSRDMEATFRERPGGAGLAISVLNNFSLPSERETPNELPFEWHPERLTVLFAGNIGRFQGLDTVIEAMERLKGREDIEFVLMGEGVAKAALEEKANALEVRVRFLGHQPVEVAKAAMQRADMGFVSLTPGMYRYAYPSKTMTYLEQGCPLLVMVEPESELAKDVSDREYGLCVQPGDAEALANQLSGLAGNRHLLPGMRLAAARKFEQAFSEDLVLEKWGELLVRPREEDLN